jgi:hypothetical protein
MMSRKGNGLKLVDAVVLSTTRELRAYVAFENWMPIAIEIRLHLQKKTNQKSFGFRPVRVPLNHVTDVQVLLSRAKDCARQPL